MTFEPGPIPAPQVRELREAGRRQARSFSAGIGVAIAMLAAVVGVALFVMLDYRLNQAPHRLVKILLGLALVGGIMMRPRIGLFLLPVLTPFLSWLPKVPVPGFNPLNVLLVGVFVSWALARALGRQDVFRPSRLGWVIGAVVALAALSIVRGAAIPTGYFYDARESSLSLFRSAVTFTVYFITLAMARGEKDRRILAWSVVIGLLAESVVTALYGRNGRGGRALGSIGQSNELGAFLAMYIVVAAALFAGVKNGLARAVMLLSVAAGTYGVMLSVSRGAIVAMVVGLFYVGLKSSRALTFMIVAVLITSPFWAPDYVKDRMIGTHVGIEGTDEEELEGSAQTRVDTWRAILTLVTEHPLDGVGFAGLAYVLPETGEAMGLEVKDSAHNTYLRFLGEMGVFGLLLFLVLLWKCWKLAGDGMRAATRPFDRQLAVGFAAATVVLAISCAFGDRFYSILVAGNFWVCAALVNDILLERREASA